MNDRERLEADIRRTQGAIKRATTKTGTERATVRLILQREDLARMRQHDPAPAYCSIEGHYKWCSHNGGVMGRTGYEAPKISSPKGN